MFGGGFGSHGMRSGLSSPTADLGDHMQIR
jgi:hypothetical protein